MCTQTLIYPEGTQKVFFKDKRVTAKSIGILTNTQTVFLEKDNLLRLTEAVTEKLYTVFVI